VTTSHDGNLQVGVVDEQLMIMIISCSSTTLTWKIPSCDAVTLSSNGIENWYSPLGKGLEYKSLDVVERVIII